MKKLIAMLLAAAMVLSLCACGGSVGKIKAGTETEGLEFTAQDGTYQVTGYHGTDVDVVIPDNHNDVPVTVIAEGAFEDSEIQTIYIGSNVEVIEKGAFSNASLLKEVTMPASLKEIGVDTTGDQTEGAFYRCVSLKRVVFADSSCLEMIGAATFYECTALEEIEIPDHVTYIGDYSFLDCVSLKELTIPASVSRVGARAFSGFTDEQEITILGDTSHWAKAADGTTEIEQDILNWYGRCNAVIFYKDGSDETTEAAPINDLFRFGGNPVYLVTKTTTETSILDNVSSITIKEYTYNSEGIRTGVYEGGSANSSVVTEYTLNSDGYQTEATTYLSNEVTSKSIETRDAENRMLTLEVYYPHWMENIPVSSISCTYNSDGSLAGSAMVSINFSWREDDTEHELSCSRTEYSYEYVYEQNTLVEIKQTCVGAYQYTSYYANGAITRSTDEEVVSGIDQFYKLHYDDYGRLILIEDYLEDELYSTKELTYDDNENLASLSTIVYLNGEVYQETYTTHEYTLFENVKGTAPLGSSEALINNLMMLSNK